MHRELMDIEFSGNAINLFAFAPQININKYVDEMQDNKETG